MIGRLRGVLAEVEEAHCLIDCAGVGYVVACGARTLQRLPAPGDEATLHIESSWSAENGPRLYGFLSREERRAFTTLTGIQGVGPKAALSVQDVRERPPERQQAADQAHGQWKDVDSDFAALVNLWRGFEEKRQELGSSPLRNWCKKNFLNYLRLREWRDSHRQLVLIARELQLSAKGTVTVDGSGHPPYKGDRRVDNAEGLSTAKPGQKGRAAEGPQPTTDTKVNVIVREQAEASVSHARESGEVLAHIANAIDGIADGNVQISTATEEQTAVANEISQNITQLNDSIQEVISGAQQSAIASRDLAQLASGQQQQVEQFRA